MAAAHKVHRQVPRTWATWALTAGAQLVSFSSESRYSSLPELLLMLSCCIALHALHFRVFSLNVTDLHRFLFLL